MKHHSIHQPFSPRYPHVLVCPSAVKEQIISKNVLKDVKVSKPKKDEIKIDELVDGVNNENFYTREELVKFLECLEKESNYKAYVLFRVLAFSGMRKQEVLALTWSDINFKLNEIRIYKALSRGLNNRLYIKTTKNEGSTRIIKMDEKTMSILKVWKKKQREDYLTLGYNTLSPNQLLFSNINNELLQPTKTRKWLNHVINKYGLKQIRTHGFRHTHCSLLFEAGASLVSVKERLGHNDIQTTMNVYAHVTKKGKDEAIQKFANYINI